MAANPNFPELVAITLNRWAATEFADAVTGHNPVFYMIRKNGNVVTGGLGVKILEPVMYLDSANGFQLQSVANEAAALNASTPYFAKGWTNAEFQWAEKLMYVQVAESVLDRQGSETQKISYISSLKDLAVKTYMEGLNLDLWRAEGAVGSDGSSALSIGSLRTYINRGGTLTTSAASGNQILTAQVYNGGAAPGGIAIGSTPLTNVGNIERNAAGAGFWCTPVVNPGSVETLTLGTVQTLVSLATRGTDYPDLIVTDRTNWNTLATILMGYQRYESGGLADAGFKQSLKFDGIDVIFDDNCPAKNIFAINSKYLKLRASTFQPKFEAKADPYRPILNWQMRNMLQLTSGHLGRVHARHGNTA